MGLVSEIDGSSTSLSVKTILRCDKALGKEQVVLILRINVRNSPAISQYVHRSG